MSPSLVEEVRRRYRGGEFQEAAEAARLIRRAGRQDGAGWQRRGRRPKVRLLHERGVDCVNVFPSEGTRVGTIRRFAASAFPDRSGRSMTTMDPKTINLALAAAS